MYNSTLFSDVPPLYVVGFTIFILLMSFMSFVWHVVVAMRLHNDLKRMGNVE